MVPFRGTFIILDAKSRLTVPARYRAAPLSEGVVLMMPIDLKPCVGV